jgi:hypothetical protein
MLAPAQSVPTQLKTMGVRRLVSGPLAMNAMLQRYGSAVLILASPEEPIYLPNRHSHHAATTAPTLAHGGEMLEASSLTKVLLR